MSTDEQTLCMFCDTPAVLNPDAYGHNLCVCDGDRCRKMRMEIVGNNSVVREYRSNPYGFEFIIEMSLQTLKSDRRDMIFNPFPYYFKFGAMKYQDDPLGQNAPRNRNYDRLNKCFHVEHSTNISIYQIIDIISGCDSDKQVVDEFETLYKSNHQEHAMDLYQFIKFIMETKNIKLNHQEMSFTVDYNKVEPNSRQAAELQRIKYKQFEVVHDPNKEAIYNANNPFNTSCYLFHGSRMENWHSIIRNGVKNCSNTSLMTAGAAYGSGVYLSDDLNVNLGYSGISESQGQYVIAVFEVYGSVDKYRKGTNVYVVNDDSYLLLRYLITVPRKNLSELSKELQQRFSQLKQNKLKLDKRIDEVRQRRLKLEMQKLSQEYFVEIEQSASCVVWKILVESCSAQILFHIPPDYPFSPPKVTQVGINDIATKDLVINGENIQMPLLSAANWAAKTTMVDIINKVINATRNTYIDL